MAQPVHRDGRIERRGEELVVLHLGGDEERVTPIGTEDHLLDVARLQRRAQANALTGGRSIGAARDVYSCMVADPNPQMNQDFPQRLAQYRSRVERMLEKYLDLPDPGTPTQPIEAGYMANAYVRMKHPDYDVLRGMLGDVGESVTVHAG